MKENVFAGNNGGRGRTSNIKCYKSKSYRGAIAPVLRMPGFYILTLTAICFHMKWIV